VSGSLLVIVNPQSRGGRTGREWPAVEPRLRDVLGPLEVVATTARRDAIRLAREAAERGVATILAAGGDGTFSEVAAGVLTSGRADEVVLGLLPLGSGGDLPRTLSIPRSLDAAFAVLASGNVRRIDAGRVRCVDLRGKRVDGWFVNEASVGLSADVALHVDRMMKRLAGRVAFGLAGARTIFGFHPNQVCARVDDKRVHEGGITLIAISNGRYFGGGMHVAPSAKIDDGRFDVLVSPAFSRRLLLTGLLPRIYKGAHLAYPGVDVHRGQRVELEPVGDSAPARVEADGELLGTLPASFEIAPGAPRVLAPPPAP